jgi:zinc transporter 1/2/3
MVQESAPVHLSPLRKRASTCESGGVNKDEYNTPLHVGAVFIILFVSTLACAFPIMAAKFPGLRIPNRFFFAVRHFGTGVLIATAFVHLLPTAFISLGDPCLSSFWNQDYPAIPGAIALAAIFLVTVIEMVFHPSRHVSPTQITTSKEGCTGSNSGGCMGGTGMLPIRDMGPIRGRSSSIGQNLSTLNMTTMSVPEEKTSRRRASRLYRRLS